MKFMENHKEYCPNCGHNRSQDQNRDQCAKCGCFTPALEFDSLQEQIPSSGSDNIEPILDKKGPPKN